MPSRKQRRRREKLKRHEYEYIYIDEEGHEVEVAPEEVKPAREKKPQARQTRGGRAARVIQPPSWKRIGKRALIFAPFMFVVISLLDKNVTVAGRIRQTVILMALFVPFSYFMDTLMYRMYLRRTGQAPPRRESKGRSRDSGPS